MSAVRLFQLGPIPVLMFACMSVSAAPECALEPMSSFAHKEIGPIPIFKDASTGGLVFASRMHVNTDGAPDSYHPDDIGITHICNGVSVGSNCTWKSECLPDFRQAKAEKFLGPTKICFFAMATKKNGTPIIQGADDPNPGYFVSTTALKQPGTAPNTTQAQLDSNTVPFAVIPKTWQRGGQPGPKLGDFGVAYRRSNDKLAFFVVGDSGPANKLGEGSVALHKALGNDPFMKRYGKTRAYKSISNRDVVYMMFPGSATAGEAFDAAAIERKAEPLLQRFGGIERLKACAGQLDSQ